MHGQADGFALVGQGALDGLFNPPCGVGAEFATFCWVEAFDGFDETDVTFADQIEQWQAGIIVIVRELDHEAQVS